MTTEQVLVRFLDGPAVGELVALDHGPSLVIVGGAWYRLVEDEAHPGDYVGLMVEPA